MHKFDYYLANGNVYSEGSVYDHIINMKYEFIVGLDFGHGETVACKYTRDAVGEWKHFSLVCGTSGEFTVPTYISYEDMPEDTDNDSREGINDTAPRILIGDDAEGGDSFLQYFKVEPGRWMTKIDAKNRTLRDAIFDFIRLVWSNILRYDDDLKNKDPQTILIAVGCPSSLLWGSNESMGAFKRLVSEATGYENVAIFPESTAAVMVPLISGAKKVDGGIAVYDVGSSTTDFTYVYMGKKLIVRSIYLGGSDIDKAMLRKALADNHLSLERFSPREISNACVRLRKIKEKFYRTGKPQNKETIWLTKDIKMDFLVDSAFMKAVLEEDTEIQKTEKDYKNHSWHECFKMFVERTGLIISGLPCEAVILTGGTSYVTDVREICEDFFGKEKIITEENPSLSVAKGLCYYAGLESKNYSRIEDLADLLSGKFANKYIDFCKSYAEYLFDTCWSTITLFFLEKSSEGSGCETNEMIKVIKQRILSKTQDDQGKMKIIELIFSNCKECRDDITAGINQFSKDIYGNILENPPELPEFDFNLSEWVKENIDLDQVLQELKTEIDILKIITYILSASVTGTLSWLMGNIFPTSVIVKVLIDLMSSGVNSAEKMASLIPKIKPELKKDDFDKISANILENEFIIYTSVYKNNVIKNTGKVLEKNWQLRSLFTRLLDIQLETALGEILFLLYTDKPSFE